MREITQKLSLWLSLLVLTSCTISPYSETAYEQATSIKATSLTLMDKAVGPYSNHSTDVEAVLLEARKAYEYANQRPKNEESTRQWAVMNDPDRKMLAGFFKKWKHDGKLAKFFIEEAKDEIGDGFDTISALESGKEKEN